MSGIARKLMGIKKSPPFNPANLIGVSDEGAYYDPTDPANYLLDGSNVATLYDLSLNSRDISRVTTGPTISTVNGIPQLDFAYTASAGLRFQDQSWIQSYQKAITVCCIATPSTQTLAGNTFWAPNITILDIRSSSSNPEVPISIGKGSSKPWLGWHDASGVVADSDVFNSGSTLTSGVSKVFTFVADGQDAEIYIDGSLDDSGTGTLATGVRTPDATNSFTLGARTLDSGVVNDPWDGQIGPLFIVNRVLSTTERQDLEGYLLNLL